MTKLYGSLEAGGTKFVCAVGDENYMGKTVIWMFVEYNR